MKFYIAVQLLCFTDFIAKHIDLSKWDKVEGKATTPIALNLQLCLRNCVCDGKVCIGKVCVCNEAYRDCGEICEII